MSDDYSYLFDLLSIPDDGSFILSDVCVEGPKKSVTLSRRAAPAFCPQCSVDDKINMYINDEINMYNF